MQHLVDVFRHQLLIALDDPWMLFSWGAQAFFTARFYVQWLHSERSGRSVVPDTFWTISIGGGAMLLIYCVHIRQWALVAGQAGGLAVYLRNYWLIRRNRRRRRPSQVSEAQKLAEDLAREIGKLGNLHDRPALLDEKLSQLSRLMEPQEQGTAV